VATAPLPVKVHSRIERTLMRRHPVRETTTRRLKCLNPGIEKGGGVPDFVHAFGPPYRGGRSTNPPRALTLGHHNTGDPCLVGEVATAPESVRPSVADGVSCYCHFMSDIGSGPIRARRFNGFELPNTTSFYSRICVEDPGWPGPDGVPCAERSQLPRLGMSLRGNCARKVVC
jgi:hypothetical protein